MALELGDQPSRPHDDSDGVDNKPLSRPTQIIGLIETSLTGRKEGRKTPGGELHTNAERERHNPQNTVFFVCEERKVGDRPLRRNSLLPGGRT